MRRIKRFSSFLRVLGIVLVLLALVLGIYALANTGSAWKGLTGLMQSSGASISAWERLGFDGRYFTALSRSVGSTAQSEDVRLQTARESFADLFDRALSAETAGQAESNEAVYAAFENEFDAEAFLDHYSLLENLMESQELKEIFEYIDGLGAVKKGKLASLKTASQEPYFQSFYESFLSEHPQAGDFYEFMLTVSSMLHAMEDAGNPVRDVKSYMTDTFTWEAYQAAYATVLAQEKTEQNENFLDALAQTCRAKLEGGNADFRGLLTRTGEGVTARYSQENLGGLNCFLSVVQDLIAEDDFDGSYPAIAQAMREAWPAMEAKSVSTAQTAYLRNVLAQADQRASLSPIAFFWSAVALDLPILLCGILLLIISAVIYRLLSRHFMNRMETAGITEADDVLLRVNHLSQYFRSGSYVNKAVDDVSFFVRKGEVFGLVGESGCGKTTTGRTIINLYDPTTGDVYFQGLRISSTRNGLPVLRHQLRQACRDDIRKAKSEAEETARREPERAAEAKHVCSETIRSLKKQLREDLREAEDHALASEMEKSKCEELYRARRQAELTRKYQEQLQNVSGEEAQKLTETYRTEMKLAQKDHIMTRMQMIFQDPIASINPRMTVREIIAEGLVIQGVKDKAYIDQKVQEMLELVGLVSEHADRYPHEFSGGQRQRIGIARAIVMQPDLIIADEPISALDVSIQAQVINLLNDLRNRMGLTLIFIAHNLSVVKYFSDRIAVMYYGKIVEMTTSDELFAHPLHPYTKSLLSAIPYPDPHYEKQRKRVEYNPTKEHDYSVDKPSLREITPGHYIHANDAEFAAYQKELGL